MTRDIDSPEYRDSNMEHTPTAEERRIEYLEWENAQLLKRLSQREELKTTIQIKVVSELTHDSIDELLFNLYSNTKRTVSSHETVITWLHSLGISVK